MNKVQDDKSAEAKAQELQDIEVHRAVVKALSDKVTAFMKELQETDKADPLDVAFILSDHICIAALCADMSKGDLLETVCDNYDAIMEEIMDDCEGCENCDPHNHDSKVDLKN
jgi:hypothetical protein